MSESIDMHKAKSVYRTLISALDRMDWNYEKFENDLVIKSGAQGDDLPINFIVTVKPERQVVQFLSKLSFDIPEDKRIDGAVAVCVANYRLCHGSFDYDVTDGNIIFRMTSSYRDSIIGDELFEYMILVSASTVDKYNDKFFMIAKGAMSLQQFIEQENSDN